MVSSQIRAEARNSLTGKWGKGALLTLVYVLVTYVITWVLNLIPFGSIASLIITPVLAFGFLVGFIKLKRGEEVGYVDFFKNGFDQFGKVWGVIGYTILKMIVPVIVLIVAIVIFAIGIAGSAVSVINGGSSSLGLLGVVGVIAYIAALIWVLVKSYSYVLGQYILYDNPDMDSKAIVEKSEELMNGHKWAYFWLPLTFLGWAILSVFTLYIGLFWLIPYMQVASVIFYESLAGTTTSVSVKEEKIEDNGPISE